MTRYQPKNPDYRRIAIDTFERQRAMLSAQGGDLSAERGSAEGMEARGGEPVFEGARNPAIGHAGSRRCDDASGPILMPAPH